MKKMIQFLFRFFWGNSEGPVIPDKSLLRCAVKKSMNVTLKLGKAVLILAVIGVLILGGINTIPQIVNTVLPVLSAALTLLAGAVLTICNFITLIPLWVYGIVAIPASIFGYSILWCIKRDLTVEDWESNAADIFALFFAVLFLAVFTFAVLFLAVFTFAVLFLFLAFAVFFLFLVSFFAIDPVMKVTPIYYIFRFPGAWWHHQKTAKVGSDDNL
jgi:hypothetical protein